MSIKKTVIPEGSRWYDGLLSGMKHKLQKLVFDTSNLFKTVTLRDITVYSCNAFLFLLKVLLKLKNPHEPLLVLYFYPAAIWLSRLSNAPSYCIGFGDQNPFT